MYVHWCCTNNTCKCNTFTSQTFHHAVVLILQPIEYACTVLSEGRCGNITFKSVTTFADTHVAIAESSLNSLLLPKRKVCFLLSPMRFSVSLLYILFFACLISCVIPLSEFTDSRVVVTKLLKSDLSPFCSMPHDGQSFSLSTW